MKDEELFVLIERAQREDSNAMERLVQDNAALVWSIVGRYTGRGVENEDLFQLGNIGLIKAIQGFDIHYGTKFSTYAVPKIGGEIRRFLRDDGLIKVSRTTKSTAIQIARMREELLKKLEREPTISELSEQLGIPIEEVAASENAMIPTDYLQRPISDDGGTLEQSIPSDVSEDSFFEQMELRHALAKLKPRDRKLILLRYFRGKTQQQCAQELGVSQVQVSRLERKAIQSLRTWMAEE